MAVASWAPGLKKQEYNRDPNTIAQILPEILQRFGMKEQLWLEELSDTIKNASLCALGKDAPNPVLSTIKHFKKIKDDNR